MKTTAIIIMLMGTMLAQNTYEVEPGTKGNEIKLTIANVSEENPATNVTVRPHPTLSKGEGFQEEIITFHQLEQTIDILNPKEEKEVTFTFDVGRNISANEKDTIEFMITSPDGIMMTKQFIFSYTGPKEFKLEQNYPNPFNPTTKIRFSVPDVILSSSKDDLDGVTLRQAQSDRVVTLKVYDVLGNEVATLVNEPKEAGYYEVELNATGFASGVYFYRLQAGSFISTKKMILLR